MKKKLLCLSCIVGWFCFTTCKKDKPSKNLPPITQEGKNTIGFKVNGEVWTPFYKCRYFGDPCGEISARYGPPSNVVERFSFGATRDNGQDFSYISILVTEPLTSIGAKYDASVIEYYVSKTGSNLGKSYTKSNLNSIGKFEVTKIDTQEQNISGIFSFKLYNTYSGVTDSLEITDGRFDFKMNACICR